MRRVSADGGRRTPVGRETARLPSRLGIGTAAEVGVAGLPRRAVHRTLAGRGHPRRRRRTGRGRRARPVDRRPRGRRARARPGARGRGRGARLPPGVPGRPGRRTGSPRCRPSRDAWGVATRRRRARGGGDRPLAVPGVGSSPAPGRARGGAPGLLRRSLHGDAVGHLRARRAGARRRPRVDGAVAGGPLVSLRARQLCAALGRGLRTLAAPASAPAARRRARAAVRARAVGPGAPATARVRGHRRRRAQAQPGARRGLDGHVGHG
jgi:hypothetical protein